MPKLFFLCLLTLSLALPAFGKSLKCRAADDGNYNRKDVAVTVVSGPVVVKPIETEYNGYEIRVEYQTGDRYESQTMLTMWAGGFASRTYNVSEKGLYQLLARGLFLQCWFE